MVLCGTWRVSVHHNASLGVAVLRCAVYMCSLMVLNAVMCIEMSVCAAVCLSVSLWVHVRVLHNSLCFTRRYLSLHASRISL